MENIYETKDLGIASLLVAMGCEMQDMEFRDNNGFQVAFFKFDNKEKCQSMAHQYLFGGMLVNARQYFDTIKVLKRKIVESKPH